MKEALLFKDATGPWLAGDFIGNYTCARIDSKNDQGVAQAGTALSIAKLMAIIVQRAAALDGDAFTHMATLLHDAVSGPDTPFLTPNKPNFTDDALRIPRNKITHIKLGWEHLKRSNGARQSGRRSGASRGCLSRIRSTPCRTRTWIGRRPRPKTLPL